MAEAGPTAGQMATGVKAAVKVAQVQSTLTEAQQRNDSSLSCAGASSCMGDWTAHSCKFFSDCLVSPKHVLEIFDQEHLLGKGHTGLVTPLKGWICVNFYIGLIYDVLEALYGFLSLELMTFLPGFISAVIYTTLGSYTWYWACIAGTNVGCCVLWIKVLVGLTVINLAIQLLDIVRHNCNVVQVSETGEESCDDNALLKLLRFFFLILSCEIALLRLATAATGRAVVNLVDFDLGAKTGVPMAGLVYFGIRAYYARLKFGQLPNDDNPNPEPIRPNHAADPPPPPPPEEDRPLPPLPPPPQESRAPPPPPRSA